MKDGGFLAIGVVTRTHGIGGKIQVRYQGDDPRDFCALREIGIGRTPRDLITHQIIHIQPHKGQFVLGLKDFTREMAKVSVGQWVWVHRDQLPPLEEDEFYWADLIGLRVVTEQGEELGAVRGLLSSGSHDILACQLEDREILIPFMEEVIRRVDLQEGLIIIHPMEGLV